MGKRDASSSAQKGVNLFFVLLPTKNKAKTVDARSKTNIRLKCGEKTE